MANKALINYYARLVIRGDYEEKDIPLEHRDAVRNVINSSHDPTSAQLLPVSLPPQEHRKSEIDEKALDEKLGPDLVAVIDKMFDNSDCDGNCESCSDTSCKENKNNE